MTVGRALLLGFAVLALQAQDCDEQTALADRLEEARDRWTRDGPADYEMVLFHGCFCPPEARGPVVVTVVGGEVASRTYVEGGGPVSEDFADLFPTVEGLFAEADEGVRRADRVEADFHPDLGYPTRLWIDWEEMAADEEVEYQVERLTPLSNPPAE